MNSAAFEGESVAGAGAEGDATARLKTSPTLWDRVAASSRFENLVKAKKRCIIPLFLLFAAYYLFLPLFTAYAPEVLARKIAGMSVAYVFGVLLIFLTWIIVAFYVKAAAAFDAQAKDIVAETSRREGE